MADTFSHMPNENPSAARVREARRSLAVSGPSHQRADGDFERVSLPTGDGDVLRDLVLDERARVMIEIGLAYGSSALAIVEALVSQDREGAEHVIIDAYQDRFENAGWTALTGVGAGSICTLVAERSQLALPRLVSNRFVADGAFVDGSHSFDNVFVDLYFLRELVRPGGLVIMDDCHWSSVATAVRYFELNRGWRRVEVDRSTRLRAFRLPHDWTDPGFEHFRPF